MTRLEPKGKFAAGYGQAWGRFDPIIIGPSSTLPSAARSIAACTASIEHGCI